MTSRRRLRLTDGARRAADGARPEADGGLLTDDRARPWGDSGSAIIEFVFIAVLVMVPLVYLIVAVAAVQRSQLAVAQAAREAGRAIATSDGPADAEARVAVAVRLALAAQGLPDHASVRFVAAGSGCSAAAIAPRVAPGAHFTVCVIRHVDLPAVPSVVSGRGVTSVGEYVVHIDDFRAVG